MQEQGGGVFKLKPELLAVPAGADHSFAAEASRDGGRGLFAEDDAIVGTSNAADRSARGHHLGDEPASFDLGKFGHSLMGLLKQTIRRFPVLTFPRFRWKPDLDSGRLTRLLLRSDEPPSPEVVEAPP